MDGLMGGAMEPHETVTLTIDGLPFKAPSLDKVMEIKSLQEQLAAAEAAVKQERDRADLLTTELQRLRISASSGYNSPAIFPSSPSGGAGGGGGLASPLTSPHDSNKKFDLKPTSTPTSPFTSATSPAVDSDMVLVPRATLEMLYLKERAMDAVKEGITIADAQASDMPLVYVNQGFARLTGYPVEAFSLGKNCRFLQGPGTEEEEVKRLSQAIKAGQACVTQITNYKRNGNPFLNYLSLTPVHDDRGTLTHYVGIQADITELVLRRKAELAAKHAAVEAAAATEAKSQFLARMSHEIRTPLNGMIAVGQLLADTKLTAAQWDLVNTIRCSGEALLTLITDILDFSKIEANKMVLSSLPFALESTIEAAMEIAGLHAARKRLQAAYHVAPGVPAWVVGDAQRLQQVLLNILNNALKFTEAGEVLLEVWAQPVGQLSSSRSSSQELPIQTAEINNNNNTITAITCNTTTNSNPTITSTTTPSTAPPPLDTKIDDESDKEYEIHFSVRDTGIGISKPDLIRLFQSFSQVDASPTRRFGGSGLGLAISQKLSEAMGGRMWAESAGLGRGSAFRWCIKSKKATDAAISAAKLSRNGGWGRHLTHTNGPSSGNDVYAGLRGKKVLLVEPCDMVRQVMLLALRQWGCQVCAVESERAAVAKLHLRPGQAPATPTPPTPTSASRVINGEKSRLSLAKAAAVELRDALAASAACCGPFDVVVLDVGHSAVLHALMESCVAEEAQKVVFLGWPGQDNPEEEEAEIEFDGKDVRENKNKKGSSSRSSSRRSSMENERRARDQGIETTFSSSTTTQTSLPKEAPPPAYATGTLEPLQAVALPPKVLTDATSRRQLGYVVVSRPVRQGRLRLGLQEVLEMEIVRDISTISNDDGGDQLSPLPTSPKEKEFSTSADGSGTGPSYSNKKSGAGVGAGVSSPKALSRLSPSNAANTTTAATAAATTIATSGGTATSGSHSPRSRSERSEHTLSESGTASPLRRSIGSTSSLLQAAPMKRISSGSSLATADGVLLGGTTLLGNSARRLLIAEDNAINMKVALGILRRLGFTNVVTAPDGVAAVEAVAAAGGPAAFDAILMDLHMPKKGGIEAVQDILRAWPHQRTKIIAVTADAFEDTRDTCVANGFTGWLAKPFRVEEFARIMGHQS